MSQKQLEYENKPFWFTTHLPDYLGRPLAQPAPPVEHPTARPVNPFGTRANVGPGG